MIPGSDLQGWFLDLNEGRETKTLVVANTGDRPIQVGPHYHFHETNTALAFDRAAAKGSSTSRRARPCASSPDNPAKSL